MTFNIASPSPHFFHKLESAFGSFFLNECAKLAEYDHELDADELEARALERTREYFHLKEKEMLPLYRKTVSWRLDLI